MRRFARPQTSRDLRGAASAGPTSRALDDAIKSIAVRDRAEEFIEMSLVPARGDTRMAAFACAGSRGPEGGATMILRTLVAGAAGAIWLLASPTWAEEDERPDLEKVGAPVE